MTEAVTYGQHFLSQAVWRWGGCVQGEVGADSWKTVPGAAESELGGSYPELVSALFMAAESREAHSEEAKSRV